MLPFKPSQQQTKNTSAPGRGLATSCSSGDRGRNSQHLVMQRLRNQELLSDTITTWPSSDLAWREPKAERQELVLQCIG